MSEPTTITITVASDGTTTVETHGFTGPECREASHFIEQALGQATGETLTPAFHQTNQQNTGRTETSSGQE